MASTFVGTFKYMSPERVKSEPYNFKSDIWSLGLVLLESVSGEAVYPDARSHIDVSLFPFIPLTSVSWCNLYWKHQYRHLLMTSTLQNLKNF